MPPSGESCPFCAFLLGTKPYTILRRSELAAILITREQRGVAHLLVVPVRHCPTILDLREEESGALMREIRLAARIVDAAEKRPGIAIWQNNGLRRHGRAAPADRGVPARLTPCLSLRPDCRDPGRARWPTTSGEH